MKNKKVIIFGVVFVIIAAIIVMGVLYFTTDFLKTEQQLFYKYLSKIQIIDSEFVNKYNEANDRIAKNSNSSTSVFDVSRLVNNQETGVNDVQKLLTVTSSGLENILMKQSYRDFTFSSNNQNFLTLRYLRDDNVYAIGADNILAKYLSIENSNLKDFFMKLGITDATNIPDSIPTNYEEIFKIDEATLEQLKQNYGMLIYNNISKEAFYKITNDDKTEAIVLSLSEQEVINTLKSIFEVAKNDTILLDLIITKAKALNYNNITTESIKTELQTFIDKISNNTYSLEKDFIKISLLKQNKSVIGIEFETRLEEKNFNSNEMIGQQMMMEGITPLDTVMQEQQINIYKYKVKFNLSELNKIIITTSENDVEVQSTTIEYIYNAENISLDILMEFKGEQNFNTSNSNIKIKYQIFNHQTDNILKKIFIDINLGSNEHLQINLSNNIVLKQDVQISKLTTENSAKLNDMTLEELSQLFMALGNRINELYGESLINMLSPDMSIMQHTIDAAETYQEFERNEENTIQYYTDSNSINNINSMNIE